MRLGERALLAVVHKQFLELLARSPGVEPFGAFFFTFGSLVNGPDLVSEDITDHAVHGRSRRRVSGGGRYCGGRREHRKADRCSGDGREVSCLAHSSFSLNAVFTTRY